MPSEIDDIFSGKVGSSAGPSTSKDKKKSSSGSASSRSVSSSVTTDAKASSSGGGKKRKASADPSTSASASAVAATAEEQEGSKKKRKHPASSHEPDADSDRHAVKPGKKETKQKKPKREVQVTVDPSSVVAESSTAATPAGTARRKTTQPLQGYDVEKQKELEDFMDSRGSSRKRTDDGLPIYSESELRIGQGGDTPLCPFDCDCCF